MSIQAVCPQCAKSIKAPDHLAGKSGKCPACAGVVPIPPAPPFDPLSVLDAPTASSGVKISTQPELKPCPFCGGEIVADMRKCRHCGEFLGGGQATSPIVRSKLICADCGSHVDGRSVTQGSCLIEACLWLFMLLPGILYSVWRLTTRHRACEKCGSRNLVPADSPRGKDLAMRFITALLAVTLLLGCESSREKFLRESLILEKLEKSWVDAKMQIKDSDKQEEALTFFISDAEKNLATKQRQERVAELSADLEATKVSKAKAQQSLDSLTDQVRKQKAIVDELQKAL